jgi:hypothetical protein
MHSVADDLRDRTRQDVGKLSRQERIDLAFRLGEADLDLFCRAQGLDRETGIRLLRRRKQAGRRPSRCMTESIG